MTPEEKALELRNKFRIYLNTTKGEDGEDINNYAVSKHIAKRAAIICADEIIDEVGDGGGRRSFWIQIKQEIEKL